MCAKLACLIITRRKPVHSDHQHTSMAKKKLLAQYFFLVSVQRKSCHAPINGFQTAFGGILSSGHFSQAHIFYNNTGQHNFHKFQLHFLFFPSMYTVGDGLSFNVSKKIVQICLS
jgi:hypothetical protein